VSLLSGGGSGHEPSFSSFVGRGLLTGAVAGTIFASPSSQQVLTALTRCVETKRGVLVIVMNYTGDVLNFGVAVEKARARLVSGRGTESQQEGDVDMVVVGDDVGVGRTKGGKVGRRGIAGTCLVIKIAGALAQKGAGLEQVSKVARLVAENVVSIGASLAHVHVPGRDVDQDEEEGGLGEGEVEIGMGIHNEPGSEKKKVDLPELVDIMLRHLLDMGDSDRAFLDIKKEDDVVLLVNNLGGVSALEMGGIVTEVIEQLKETWNIKPKRILSGTFMTSLNGIGFSVSLLRLRDTGLGHGNSMLELLDAPAEAAGWSANVQTKTWEKHRTETRQDEPSEEDKTLTSNFKGIMRPICNKKKNC
jgi:triose/dihydroxyacetone kinase / FAD-AMP lyase (cyclizing)